MLPNVGTWEMLIILLVVFLVFGSKRLPDVAKGIGRGMREFKREMQGLTDELKIPDEDRSVRPTASATPAPKPANGETSSAAAAEDAPAGNDTPSETTA